MMTEELTSDDIYSIKLKNRYFFKLGEKIA